MRRRDFIAGSLAAAVAPAGAVAQPAPQGPFTPASQQRFIDAHCHLFNILDVPAESFIKKVVLPNVVSAMGAGSRDYAALFQDPKFKGSFEVMLHMLAVAVSRKACEPDDELWALDEMEHRGARPRNAQKVESDLLKDILDEVWWPKVVGKQMKLGDRFVSFTALNQIKYLLRKEAFPGLSEQELRGMSADEASDCREAARVIYAERDGVFSRTIRWGLLFTRYRFQLAEELQRLHGGRAKLMTPALVDFTAWFGPLGQSSGDRTVPMRRQVEVMARIAQRRNGPRVHGFVGFDPLRQALFRAAWRSARGRAARGGEEGGRGPRLHRREALSADGLPRDRQCGARRCVSETCDCGGRPRARRRPQARCRARPALRVLHREQRADHGAHVELLRLGEGLRQARQSGRLDQGAGEVSGAAHQPRAFRRLQSRRHARERRAVVGLGDRARVRRRRDAERLCRHLVLQRGAAPFRRAAALRRLAVQDIRRAVSVGGAAPDLRQRLDHGRLRRRISRARHCRA